MSTFEGQVGTGLVQHVNIIIFSDDDYPIDKQTKRPPLEEDQAQVQTKRVVHCPPRQLLEHHHHHHTDHHHHHFNDHDHYDRQSKSQHICEIYINFHFHHEHDGHTLFRGGGCTTAP